MCPPLFLVCDCLALVMLSAVHPMAQVAAHMAAVHAMAQMAMAAAIAPCHAHAAVIVAGRAHGHFRANGRDNVGAALAGVFAN